MKVKQALPQSPGRGENINWAEIQHTQVGGGHATPINHINLLKSGRIGWTPTQIYQLFKREHREKARLGFSQNENEICDGAGNIIICCENCFSLLLLVLNERLAQRWPWAGTGSCGYPLEWNCWGRGRLWFFPPRTSALAESKCTKSWNGKVPQAMSSLNTNWSLG